MIDITLLESPDGIMLHRPDCPMVLQQRAEGRPLATLFQCDMTLLKSYNLHSCLTAIDLLSVPTHKDK
jgi:hypothetical protein